MLLKILFVFSFVQYSLSDTPANCTFEDAIGTWRILTAPLSPNCTGGKFVQTKAVNLIYPNIAIDEFGNYGHWTLIYNQGFEIVINNMKYFGFFDFLKINDTYSISYCNRLQPLWYHDVLIRQWMCFRAEKVTQISIKSTQHLEKNVKALKSQKFGSQKTLVETINKANVGWTAHDYTEFHNKTLYEMLNMAGGFASRLQRPKTAPPTKEQIESLKFLPELFDWRNVNGINYVSPVRHQDQCGSCYSFASAGMLEARYRIRSNNTMTPILSPQDVVECSPYSQGCDGGFPYLIGGKYAEDAGMVEEVCNPYKGKNGKCSTNPVCKRYYATNYKYIGGFYGAGNEPLMRMELVKNGPIAVGFEVYGDFRAYKTGVYHHVFNTDKLVHSKFGFNPFELTNHAVLIVGYGKTIQGEKYWIVKNSWGPSWGDNGFFKIRRGNDECGIESLAVASEPIL